MKSVGFCTVILMLLFVLCASDVMAFRAGANNAQQYYHTVYEHVCCVNPRLGKDKVNSLTRSLLDASYQTDVDPLLVAAMYTHESAFNQDAVSSVGARGIAQIMPDTAVTLGIDIHDVNQNIAGGARYLAMLIREFSWAGDWNVTYAVAAYNAGPGAVEKYRGVPPYAETRNYVNAVALTYRQLGKKLNLFEKSLNK